MWFCGFFAVVILLVVLVLRFAAGPRFLALFKPSGFERPEQVGAVVAKRLFLEFKESPLVVIGLEERAKEQVDFVRGLLEDNSKEFGLKPTIVLDSSLGEVTLPDTKVMDFREEYAGLKTLIQQQLDAKASIVLITSNMIVSQILQNSLSKDLKQEFKLPLISLSVLRVARKPSQEPELRIKCHGSGEAAVNFGQLGCLSFMQSRSLYKLKKPITEPYIAVFEETVGKDYLLYLSF